MADMTVIELIRDVEATERARQWALIQYHDAAERWSVEESRRRGRGELVAPAVAHGNVLIATRAYVRELEEVV